MLLRAKKVSNQSINQVFPTGKTTKNKKKSKQSINQIIHIGKATGTENKKKVGNQIFHTSKATL
jgi:hypothetical protein